MSTKQLGNYNIKSGLAKIFKGGLIMDVTNADEARLAEKSGACAVMALDRLPVDIRKDGGVARMTDPQKIKEIMKAVTIPVMAKARIGHFVEAQILQAIGVDMIDESEVLSPADPSEHINKHAFTVPFVSGAENLSEALKRIQEGAAIIRTKGNVGSGDVIEVVRNAKSIKQSILNLDKMDETELESFSKSLGVSVELVRKTKVLQKLPVANFAAGGLATPADVALLMQLGVDGVFVGSVIFKSENPQKRAEAMIKAVTHYTDANLLAQISENLGEAMIGLNSDVVQNWRL